MIIIIIINVRTRRTYLITDEGQRMSQRMSLRSVRAGGDVSGRCGQGQGVTSQVGAGKGKGCRGGPLLVRHDCSSHSQRPTHIVVLEELGGDTAPH